MACVSSYSASDETEYPIHQLIDIPNEMEPKPTLWPECCIYRVAEPIRKIRPEAYTPQLISIGPMHRQNEALKPMEKEKRTYFHFFQKRLSDELGAELLRQYYKKKLLGQQPKIRRSYSEDFPDLSEDKFADMILLDAVFIMELFLRIKEGDNINDRISPSWVLSTLMWDLVLLENQLPIFVLVELYDTLFPYETKNNSHDQMGLPGFLGLANCYFASFGFELPNGEKQSGVKDFLHFTDMIRHVKLPSKEQISQAKSKSAEKINRINMKCSKLKSAKQKEEVPAYNFGVIKNALKLKQAGVSFVAVDKCLSDISFKVHWFSSVFPCVPCWQSRFEFPQLRVENTTELILRNVVALEQHHYPDNALISGYVCLLDDLIETKEDVDLLVEKGLIVNTLGSNQQLADVANSLRKHVLVSSGKYRSIVTNLNKFSSKKWPRRMATLRSVYFRDLWRGSATVVAIVVFFFTFVSFVATIRG